MLFLNVSYTGSSALQQLRTAEYEDADPRRQICQQIRGLTVGPIMLQASAYIAVVIWMTATFLVYVLRELK